MSPAAALRPRRQQLNLRPLAAPAALILRAPRGIALAPRRRRPSFEGVAEVLVNVWIQAPLVH